MADRVLEQGEYAANGYLSTLALAYVAEAQCYIQLGEMERAQECLREGTQELRPRYEKLLVDILFEPTPAMYLHPDLEGHRVHLSDLTYVYRWLQPHKEWDEDRVFEDVRDALFILARDDSWMRELPQAIGVEDEHTWRGVVKNLASATEKLPVPRRENKNVPRLPENVSRQLSEMFAEIGQAVETEARFRAYQMEIEVMLRLGASTEKWAALTSPAEGDQDESLVMSIVFSEPLAVAV